MANLRNVTDFRGFDRRGSTAYNIKDEPVSPRGDFSPCFNPEEQFSRRFEDLKLEPQTPDMRPLSRPSLSMSDLANIRPDARIDLGESRESHRDVMRRYSRRPVQGAEPRSPPALSRGKFVSMAEAIYHFQRDTPGRFHTAGRAGFHPQHVSPVRVTRTRPVSPTLRCATRARPVRLPTAQEREQLELEEIRKFKIRAQPIPRAVVRGGHLPDVVRRERTVPEPFKLTEVQRRAPPEPEPGFVFKAHPVPRRILEKQHIPPKPASTITKPITPTFLKVRARSHETLNRPVRTSTPPKQPRRALARLHKSSESNVDVPHHGVGQYATRIAPEPVRVEPFSFEKRDEYIRKKREEKIKSIINQEKSLANQFKAKPVPRVVRKKAVESVSCKRSEASSGSSENKENYKFEARPPLVLAQKPFRPVLTQAQVTEVKPFALTTVRRASERELYDKQLKEKEEEVKRLAEQREKERQAEEERERARLRALLVHHAQPVPDLVPFVPEKSNAPLTEPQTPMFVRRLKKNQ